MGSATRSRSLTGTKDPRTPAGCASTASRRRTGATDPVATLMAMAWPIKDHGAVVRVTAEPREPERELRDWWEAWEHTEPVERDVPAAVVLAEIRNEP